MLHQSLDNIFDKNFFRNYRLQSFKNSGICTLVSFKILQMHQRVCNQEVANCLKRVDSYANEIPAVIMLHNMQDLSIVYMSKRGRNILGVSLQDLVNMGTDYHTTFFNEDEIKEQVPKMIGFLERNNDDELIALFQQVRRNKHFPWTWYCTSVKIFSRDQNGKPLLIMSISIPIDPDHHLSHKVSRLLEENNFLRKNSNKFHKLSSREKEVLRLLALGKTSQEISEEIHISPLTVDTHRKNIKQKLGSITTYEMGQYARAFDLI